MSLIKLNAKDRKIQCDGQYATSGKWIVDLDKDPFGELLKTRLGFYANKKSPQLNLLPEEEWDYKKLIPGRFDSCEEIYITPLKYAFDGEKELATAFINKSSDVVAWISDEYLKLFNDIKWDSAYTEGNSKLVCFTNEEREFLFGIMPVKIDNSFKYFDFLSQHYWNLENREKLKAKGWFGDEEPEENQKVTISTQEGSVETDTKTIKQAAKSLKK